MKYTDDLNRFLAEYERYKTDALEPTHADLKKLLSEWETAGFWAKYTTGSGVATPSPVRMILTRIKAPEKVVDKIFRKPDLFPDGLSARSLQRMHDAIGVRIVVYFTSQLPLIDRALRDSSFLQISDERRPEAYLSTETLVRVGLGHLEQKHKESGYSSIHYALRLTEPSADGGRGVHFELQVKTSAQELWSELEHVLCYKPQTRTSFSAKRRLQIMSKQVGVIDEHFDLLYEELIHSQEIATYQDLDTLTFENLPKVMIEIGIQCALTELNPILRILFSRGVTTIGDLLKIATPQRLATIRNTYVATIGHAPDNLELVAALAILKGAQTKAIEIERIKAQIDYRRSR